MQLFTTSLTTLGIIFTEVLHQSCLPFEEHSLDLDSFARNRKNYIYFPLGTYISIVLVAEGQNTLI